MSKESTISIFIKQMQVNVCIGLADYEKKGPQALAVSLELFADPSYLSSVQNETIIDYVPVYEAIKSWEERGHVELVETYLKELLDLAFSFEGVSACRASIHKPEVFAEAQGAGVEVFMHREDWQS